MHIAITGSTGLVGKALVSHLGGQGVRITRLVRRRPQAGEVFWNPSANNVDPGLLSGCDAVVHLAGENIANGRWNKAKKKRICQSRVESTRLLSATLAAAEKPPQVLVSASAIGYYGETGDQLVDEQSPSGDDFLAEVCRQWESATLPAKEAQIRVANVRIGMVLAGEGGALQKMLTPFRLCLGGRIGSGRQFWSWIAISDLVRTLEHIIHSPALSGPVNAVAPQPVTNLQFTKALSKTLRRPALLPLPAAIVRLMLGEMADALLLSSTRVSSALLENSGFIFKFSDIQSTLQHLLDKKCSCKITESALNGLE